MLRRRWIGLPDPDVLAADTDHAFVSIDQAIGQAQQRRLAGAGPADDAAEFARCDVERHIAQCLDAAAIETLADVRIADGGRGGGHHD